MPAGQNASEGTRPVVFIGGNFTNLVSGLPLDATKSDYLQANSLRSRPEGGTLPSNKQSGADTV